MKEYIERAAVHELVKRTPKYEMFNYDRTTALLGIDPDDVDFGVDKIPAADVVDVVRCKDCEWFCETHDEMDSLVCLNRQWDNGQPWRAAVKPDDFCSYGARMDKEEQS